MSNPKVSVVSVYYNRRALVRESTQSLLDQSFRDFELILVDDGSTDGTLEEMKSIADPRIRVLQHPNQGFVKSIRKAVDHAKGKYIAIHGSGDISFPGRLEKQISYLEVNPDVGLVGCHSEKVNLVTGVNGVFAPRTEDIDMIRGNSFTHGEVMFRRSVYDQVGGYRDFFTYSQDYDLFLRMEEVCKLQILHEVLYRRFTQPDGVSGSPRKIFLQCFYAEMARECAHARRRETRDLVEEFGNAAWLMRSTSSNGVKHAAPTVKLAFLKGEPEVAWDLAKRILIEARNLKSVALVFYAFVRKCIRR